MKLGLKRVGAFLIVMVMLLGIMPVQVAKADEDDVPYGSSGVFFYLDEACTKQIVKPVKESENTRAHRYYRMDMLSGSTKKIYLLMKNSDYSKYRPLSDGKVLTVKDRHENDVTDKVVGSTIKVKNLNAKEEEQYLFEVEITGACGYDYLKLEPIFEIKEKYPNGESEWDSYFGSPLSIDFVDEGLNACDKYDTCYSQYIFEKVKEDTVAGRLYFNLGRSDYGKQNGFCAPAPNALMSFAVWNGEELITIEDASKLTVYEKDGKTVSDKVKLEQHYHTEVGKLIGVMKVVFSGEDACGDYIIRYSDGAKSYDLDFTVGLPAIGLYSAPERSEKNFISEAYLKNEKPKNYYILTDHAVAWEDIHFESAYHGDWDDCFKCEKVKDITGDGVYGYEVKITPTWDGPTSMKMYITGDNMGSGASSRESVFFYMVAVKKGVKKTIDGYTYQVTKYVDSTSSMGGVKLLKAKKGKKYVTLGSPVNIYGRKYLVTEIKDGVFKNDKKLKEVRIGNDLEGEYNVKLKKIGKNAFCGCTALKSIDLKYATNLKSIGKNAFKGVPKTAKAIVPPKHKKRFIKMLRKAGFRGTFTTKWEWEEEESEAKKKIEINNVALSMQCGKKSTLYLKNLKKKDYGKVSWSSSDTSVAKVSYNKKNGKATVKTLTDGEVTIKAKYKSKTYKCKFFVWEEGKNIGFEGDPIVSQAVEAYAKDTLEGLRGTEDLLDDGDEEETRIKYTNKTKLGSPFVIIDEEDRTVNKPDDIYYFPIFDDNGKMFEIMAVIDLDVAGQGEGLTVSISREWLRDIKDTYKDGMINEYLLIGGENNLSVKKLSPRRLINTIKNLKPDPSFTAEEIAELKNGHHTDWLDPDQVIAEFIHENNFDCFVRYDDNGLVSKTEDVSAAEKKVSVQCDDGVSDHIEITLKGTDIGGGVMAWKLGACELR